MLPLAVMVSLPVAAFGLVGGPALDTDGPFYPGIGAYAWYDTGEPGALVVPHVYKDASGTRTHTEKIAHGTRQKKYAVNCGTNVTNLSVASEAPKEPEQPAEAARTPAGASAPPKPAAAPAKGLPSLAKNYLRAGIHEKASEPLQRVVTEYPDAPEATEARKLLTARETE